MTLAEKLNQMREELYLEMHMEQDEVWLWVYTNDDRHNPEFDRGADTLEEAVDVAYQRYLNWKEGR